MSDLGKLWDYLRHDPKWEIDPARNYGGVIFFGSKDIGGASVVANMVRDRGLDDVLDTTLRRVDPRVACGSGRVRCGPRTGNHRRGRRSG